MFPRRTLGEAHLASIDQSKGEPISLKRLLPDLLFIAFALGLPFGLCSARTIFRDGDVSWQVATGRWILQHGRIPTTDPFSYTAFGSPWVAMEWLAQIIYATAFNLDGYAGLATVVSAAVIALFAIVYFHLQNRAPLVGVVLTLLLVAVVIQPFILARPHVLAWVLIALWTVLLSQAAEKGRPPPLWTTLLLVIWTNLHASFPLAIIILAAFAFDSARDSNWTTIRPWLIYGLASLAALILNANGIAGLRQPFETTSLTMLPFIAEWHASTTNSTPEFFAAVIVGIGVLLYLGVRVPAGRLLLLLFLFWLAFVHVRHQSFFVIVAACALPPLTDRNLAPYRVSKWLVAGILPLLAFQAFTPQLPPEGFGNPRRLIAAIPAELRDRPVLNDYSFGGPLILAGIRPFIDGRAEIYGDVFVGNYFRITGGDMRAFDDAVRRYDIRWTMLSHDQAGLIRSMEASGQWRRVYSDEIGVIDVRRSMPAQPSR